MKALKRFFTALLILGLTIATPIAVVDAQSIFGSFNRTKMFTTAGNHTWTKPANAHFGPIIVERSTPGFYIAGKVVGLIRKM